MESAGTLPSIEFSKHYFHLHVHQLIKQPRCMEHLLHLGVSHILSHITPTPTQNINVIRNGNEEDESSADDLSTDESDATTQGALHKMIELIKQVCQIDCNYHMY